jgi:hypothetical protein
MRSRRSAASAAASGRRPGSGAMRAHSSSVTRSAPNARARAPRARCRSVATLRVIRKSHV